jgi:hypothetical protein
MFILTWYDGCFIRTLVAILFPHTCHNRYSRGGSISSKWLIAYSMSSRLTNNNCSINKIWYNQTIMKWSLPNQIMCFLLPVDSKPTADTMSVNKSKATFEIEQCWIFAVLCRPFWKWRPVDIFRCRESIQDIIIYLHMKFRWNRNNTAQIQHCPISTTFHM